MKRVLSLVITILVLVVPTTYAAIPEADQEKVIMLLGYSNEVGLGSIRSLGGRVLQDFAFIGVAKVELSAGAIPLAQTAKGIEFIEPDYEVNALGQVVPWGIERVRVPEVRSVAMRVCPIAVAVLDTGISTSHPDLVVAGGCNTVGGISYNDDNGHGTHVAGIVAARNNDIGVIGCSQAKLYAVKVLNSQGGGSISTVIGGIDWAITNGMKVINMSIGTKQASLALELACNSAYNEGILLVAAAGNDGTPGNNYECIDYPAKYSSVIAVGSITAANTLSSFSSIGPELEIVAPGSLIYSTTYHGGYGIMSGTSMACPHVAGVAALLWGERTTLTNVELRVFLDSYANDLWGDPWRYGNGLVDAWATRSFIFGGPMIPWENPYCPD